jgi:hypothetical protein
MAVQANQPIKPGKSGGGGLGGFLGAIGGAAIGGAVAGPAGAVKGASFGKDMGSTVGGAVAPGQEASQAQGAPGTVNDNPMKRRLEAGETQAKMTQLRDSAMATADLPPEQREQYLNPIMTAAAQLSPRKAQV